MKALLVSLALGVLASPAGAQDYVAFHSPSGNIHCAIVGGDFPGARCDMTELTPSFAQRPADCELDWGSSFAVDPESREGYLACVGDTVADPSGFVLGYGEEISVFDITCTSEETGMTCTNPAGHGFSVSKAKQEVF